MQVDTEARTHCRRLCDRVPGAILLGVLVMLGLSCTAATAHSGRPIEEDRCTFRLWSGDAGGLVHFAGYQPGATRQALCRYLPATGPSFLVVDLVSSELRERRVGVLIVPAEDTAGSGDWARPAVARRPPALTHTGTVTLQYDFAEPGSYEAVVWYEGGANKRVAGRFPFFVGRSDPRKLIQLIVSAVGSLLVAGVVVLVVRRILMRRGKPS